MLYKYIPDAKVKWQVAKYLGSVNWKITVIVRFCVVKVFHNDHERNLANIKISCMTLFLAFKGNVKATKSLKYKTVN